MKLRTGRSAFFLVGGLAALAGGAVAGERACNVKDCFFARDVRSFDVIDKTTVIVYVGSQHCPFRVDLRGTFCDLTYAPELVFSDPSDVPLGEPDPRTQGPGGFSDLANSSLPSQRRSRATLKVCDNDLRLQVSGGVFTESSLAGPLSDPSTPRDRFGRAKTDCQISRVSSITDDQVLEIFVAHRVTPPPPPMGSGDIQVAKQAGEDTSPAPARKESGKQ